MNLITSFSRRIFFWSLAIHMITALGCIAAFHYGGRYIGSLLPVSVLRDAAVHSEALNSGLEQFMPVADLLKTFYIPSILGAFLMIALVSWVVLRGTVVRCFKKNSPAAGPAASFSKKDKLKDRPLPESAPDSVITKKDLTESNRRYYLHLFSLLQREGRLMDFFDEDLGLYDDAQIGAAVRGIHDGCKNLLKKHINPRSVMEQAEGETITVPVAFDPNAIKLTGNVTGEPPFRGTLRHRGWRAGRTELPTLTPVRDSSIIAPAEVEIA